MYFNNRIQIALFFNKFDERADLYFYELNKSLDNIFDMAPINIPVPPNAPIEIPLLNATSTNNFYNLSISKLRIDFTLNNINIDDSANEKANKFYRIAMRFLEYVQSNQQIVRFGLVSTTLRTDGNPVDLIKKRYFNKTLSNPSEVTIRYNNPRKRESMLLNDIVEISSVNAIINNSQKNILVITRDINNILEQGIILKKQDLRNAFEFFYNELLVDKVKELI